MYPRICTVTRSTTFYHAGKFLDVLTDLAYSPALGRIAMGGSSCVRILDTSGNEYAEIKSDAIDLGPSETIEKVGLGPRV